VVAHPEPPVETGPEAGYDELPDDVEQLKAMVLAERTRAARLEHILKLINRTTFGKRSEKLPVDQLALALEEQDVALAEADGLQDKAAEEAARYGLRPRRRRPADAERPSLPAHLPRFETVIEPENLECTCGGILHKIGEDRSERLDIIPALHRVMVTIRPRYACRCCSDGVSQVRAPAHVVPGGLPTEALIADVLINKYCDHLPLYRQSKILARQGITISRATLANWVGRGIAALMPITNRMRADALASARLFVDETTVKVLAPGTGKTKTGYMWVIVRDDRAHGGADPPLALYTYMPGRGKMWARQLLGSYQGILQVDAWQAYDQFGKEDGANAGLTKSYCWAHYPEHGFIWGHAILTSGIGGKGQCGARDKIIGTAGTKADPALASKAWPLRVRYRRASKSSVAHRASSSGSSRYTGSWSRCWNDRDNRGSRSRRCPTAGARRRSCGGKREE
jgi:transposase